jgi:23S rRNA (guanosine2251-2'-O)-methyltransferase
MEKLRMDALNRISTEDFKASAKTPIIVVLDNVRSMHNVGSVFRTADGFLIEKIYLCGFTPQPPHRDIQKTALGATETVAWEYAEDTATLIKTLKKEGITVIAVEQVTNSILLQNFTCTTEKIVVVFGNEVDGVSDAVIALCDVAIEIPQLGTKHSLNVSVAAGIVLWKLFEQQLEISNEEIR